MPIFPEISNTSIIYKDYAEIQKILQEGSYQLAVMRLEKLKEILATSAESEATKNAIEIALNNTRETMASFNAQCEKDYDQAVIENGHPERLQKILERWRKSTHDDPELLKRQQDLDELLSDQISLAKWEDLDNLIKTAKDVEELEEALIEANLMLSSMSQTQYLYDRVTLTRDSLQRELERKRAVEKIDTASSLEEYDEGIRLLEQFVREGKFTYKNLSGAIIETRSKLKETYSKRAGFLKAKATQYLSKAKQSLDKGIPENAFQNLEKARRHAEEVAADFRQGLEIPKLIEDIENILEDAERDDENCKEAILIRGNIDPNASKQERLRELRRARDTYPLLNGLDKLIERAEENFADEISLDVSSIISDARLIINRDRQDNNRFERSLRKLAEGRKLLSSIGKSDLCRETEQRLIEAENEIQKAQRNWETFREQLSRLSTALNPQSPNVIAAEDIMQNVLEEFRDTPELSMLRAKLIVYQKDEPALKQFILAYDAGDHDFVINAIQDKFSKSSGEIFTRSQHLVLAARLAKAQLLFAKNTREGLYREALSNLDEIEQTCTQLEAGSIEEHDVIALESVRLAKAQAEQNRHNLQRLSEMSNRLEADLTRIHSTWWDESRFGDAHDELKQLEANLTATSDEASRMLLMKVQTETASLRNAWYEHHWNLITRYPNRIEDNYAFLQEITQANLNRAKDRGREEQIQYQYWQSHLRQALSAQPKDYIAARDCLEQIIKLPQATEADKLAYREYWREALSIDVSEGSPDTAAEEMENLVLARRDLRDDFDLHEIVLEKWLDALDYQRAQKFVERTHRLAVLQVQKRLDYFNTLIEAHRIFHNRENPDYFKALSILSLLLENLADDLSRREKIQERYNEWRGYAIHQLLSRAVSDQQSGKYVDAIQSYGRVLDLQPAHPRALTQIHQLRGHLDTASEDAFERSEQICTHNPSDKLKHYSIFEGLLQEVQSHESNLRRLYGVYTAIQEENSEKAKRLEEERKVWAKLLGILARAGEELRSALSESWDLDPVTGALARITQLMLQDGKNIIRLSTLSKWVNELTQQVTELTQRIEDLKDHYREDDFDNVPIDVRTLHQKIGDLKMRTSDLFEWKPEKIRVYDGFGVLIEYQGVPALLPAEIVGDERIIQITKDRSTNYNFIKSWSDDITKNAKSFKETIDQAFTEADVESLLKAITTLEAVQEAGYRELRAVIQRAPRFPESPKAYKKIQQDMRLLLQEELVMSDIDDLQSAHPNDVMSICQTYLDKWVAQKEQEISAKLCVSPNPSELMDLSLYDRYKLVYGPRDEYGPEGVSNKEYGPDCLAYRIAQRCKAYRQSKRKISEAAIRDLKSNIEKAIICDRSYIPPCDISTINEGKKDLSWWEQVFQRAG